MITITPIKIGIKKLNFSKKYFTPKIKNGVFTHRIIQALKDKATDKNSDSFISVLELSTKLREPQNNSEYQYPVIRNVGRDVRLSEVEE